MAVTLILLGAGAATRMRGGDKMLEPAPEVPCLRLLAERGIAAGLKVRVAVPSLDHPRAHLFKDLSVDLIAVPDASQGMARSLVTALRGVTTDAAMILPGDMPEITRADLHTIATHPGDIVQATAADGTPGHPVRFPRRLYPALLKLSGDVGARSILRAQAGHITRVALPGQHAVTDLDTPEAWAAWRAGQAAQ